MLSLEQNSKGGKTKQTDKTRKRTRNPERHEHFKQKCKVQRGLEHTTKSGNIITAKIFREQTECGGCKKQCSQESNALIFILMLSNVQNT